MSHAVSGFGCADRANVFAAALVPMPLSSSEETARALALLSVGAVAAYIVAASMKMSWSNNNCTAVDARRSEPSSEPYSR